MPIFLSALLNRKLRFAVLKPLDHPPLSSYTQPFSVGLLIPGVGLWNYLGFERVCVDPELTSDTGQPQ
jgi:hypothetical protein